MSLILLSLLACTELPIEHKDGPGLTAPSTGCTPVEEALALDEVGVVGFSGADVEAVVAGTREAEFEYADGSLTNVTVEVTRAGDPIQLTWIQDDPAVPCDAEQLLVDFDVRVVTDDGAIDATVTVTSGGATLPTELFLSAYAAPADLAGALMPPPETQSLSVVVHHREGDPETHGILQWVVEPPGEMPSELDIGAWGSYRQ